jgi:hypothetical protein
MSVNAAMPIEVPFKEVVSTVQQLQAIASDNFRMQIAAEAEEQSFWTFTIQSYNT